MNKQWKIGDLVLKRSGSLTKPAEVRAIFTSRKGKPMIAVEFERDTFRIFREQQVIRVGLEDAKVHH